MKKRSTKFKWVALALAGLGATVSSGAMAHTQVESDGGLKIYNPADSAYWFSIGGRLDFDETIFSGSHREKGPYFPSGGNIRRAFIKLMGGVGDFLTYNFTPSFANHVGPGVSGISGSYSGGFVDFEDAWINYSGIYDNTNLRFGQFTPLTTVDNWGRYGTVNDTIFLEPSIVSVAFQVPTKAYGLWFDTAIADMITFAATAYHPRQNHTFIPNALSSPNNYQNPNRSDRLGGAVRVTFAPVHTEDTVLHLGALGRFQSMNNVRNGLPVVQSSVFATYPEALARNTASLLNTGSSFNTGNLRARSYNVVTGEVLGIFGPLMIEGEYSHANIQRVPFQTTATTVGVNTFTPTVATPAIRGNARFHGWHAQAAYVLTGETRGYDFTTGTIQNPSPASKCGAWEIAVRYSYVDLNDKNIFGGTEHNTTIGLNWFVNDNVRLAANYIRANIRNTNPLNFGGQAAPFPIKRQLDIFGMRIGVMF